ncbi:fibronectin type 3 and ankyrin repeat domains 1 protein-like [Babylonia areolata]|uniref:fibronectin type 3 and ankyrin repeat domains 1 protein-like n=1 Tax=Babylonia areolata TaxID=304850 RepID=UPI003FD04017
MSELGTPPTLQVGAVNHFSVELVWEDALKEANEKCKGKGPVKVILEQKDMGIGKKNSWNVVYKGMAKKTKVTDLEPESPYAFRYQFDQKGSLSSWSPEFQVTTTREPLYANNLHMAIKRENVEDLQDVLKSGEVSPDGQNDDGFTALMAAAKKPFIEAIDVLIDHGAEVDFQNRAGKTALMIACAANMLNSVRALRKHNAKYDIYDKGGCTAIHWAVDARDVKLIDWLASDHADLNIKDRGNGGWTPLIRCANLHGDRDVGLALMMGGADINGTDNSGSTVLHHAIMRKHYDLVQVLLQRQANPLQENDKTTTPWQIATSSDDKRPIAQLMEPFVEEWKKKQSRMKKNEMSIAPTQVQLS